ncbi:hypothetical protein Hanom_Chr01g00048991 [Helianthus anomalus]
MYLSDVYKAYTEAKWANGWSVEKECFVDPQGNPIVDLIRYREKVEEGIRKVIYTSLEKKKKTVEEIIDESKKIVDEVAEEDQIQETKEATVPKAEVITLTDSSVSLNKIEIKTEEQYKKCMETCSACTEKDRNMRSIDIEFTKIERIFKEKCNKQL